VQTRETQDPKFFKNIPKIELHLHIEGAIPVLSLWELVQKYDKNKTMRSEKDLEARFVYKDFSHFLDTWTWKNTFLREYEDFSFIATEVVKDLIDQHYRYVEFFFTPPDHAENGIESQRLLEALYDGVKNFFGQITVSFIFDISRNFGPENGMILLEQMKEMKGHNLVGMGMGGSEHLYPPEPFKDVYRKAKDYGFHTTVHAGEAAGPNSVWAALRILSPDRIGHGTRIIEDPELLNYVKERKIPIELCPISNVRTGVVKSLLEHPIREYYDNNLNIFINTDDPKMFNTSLENEFIQLESIGFGKSDVKVMLNNAIDSAWSNEETKNNLRKEIDDYYCKNFKVDNTLEHGDGG
jgi:adenosine deaminase